MSRLHADSVNQQNYFGVYLEIKDAEKLEKQNNYVAALVRYKVGALVLEKLRQASPYWDSALVVKAIADYREKIMVLEPSAARQIKDEENRTLSSGPPWTLLYENGLKEPDVWKAMNDVEEYQTRLEIIRAQNPEWEKDFVEKGIKKSSLEIDQLAARAIKPITEKSRSGNTVQ